LLSLRTRQPLAQRLVSTVARTSAAVPRAALAAAVPLSVAIATTKIACAMPKKKSAAAAAQQRPSDAHVKPWDANAPAGERIVEYDKDSPTLIKGGEKIPLLPGQRVGDRKKDWVPYFASAANRNTKKEMIGKVMDMSLSEWPLGMKGWAMDKVLDAFEKMGMPFQPYTVEGWYGCRRHPANEGFQTGAQRQIAGWHAGGETLHKRTLKARRQGIHCDVYGNAVVEPSESARRGHAYRRKADNFFFERGFTDVPAAPIALKVLQRAFPRWPLYTTDLHCAGCLGHVLNCFGDTNYEHVHGQGPLGGSERTCCTGRFCGEGHLVVVDWFRQTCGAEDDDIKGFAGHLAEFVRPGGVKPGASTFLDLAAQAAKASRRSGAADGATGGAAVFDADALAPAEPLLTRARRMPPQRADVVMPGADWAPTADAVTRVLFDVEATRVEGDVEVVQLALVAPEADARYVEFVEPEGSISSALRGNRPSSCAVVAATASCSRSRFSTQVRRVPNPRHIERYAGEARRAGLRGRLRRRGRLARQGSRRRRPRARGAQREGLRLPGPRRPRRRRRPRALPLRAPRHAQARASVTVWTTPDIDCATREPLRGRVSTNASRAGDVFPGRTGLGSYSLPRLYGDATHKPLDGHHGALADAKALEPVLEHLVKTRGGDVEAFVRGFAAAWRRRAAARAGRRASAALEDEAAERGDAAAADDDDAGDDAPVAMDTSPAVPTPLALSARRRDAVAAQPAELSPAAAASTDDGPSAEDVEKMKVTELKAALEERGLATDGLKAVLKDRLLEALDGGRGDEPERKRRRQKSPSPSPPQRAGRVSLGAADPEDDDDDDAALAEDAAEADDVEASRADDELLRTLDAAEAANVEAMAAVAALPGAAEPLPATFDLDGLSPGQLAELACRASAKLAEKARGARSIRDGLVEVAECTPLSIVKRALDSDGRHSSSDDDAEAVVRDRYLGLLLEEAGAAS